MAADRAAGVGLRLVGHEALGQDHVAHANRRGDRGLGARALRYGPLDLGLRAHDLRLHHAHGLRMGDAGQQNQREDDRTLHPDSE